MSFNLSTPEVAAIAIFFTFLGVLINNGFNLLMHNKRAKFESDQKEKERIHNLRKDIYLIAADKSVRIGGLICDQTNPNVDINQLKNDFNEFCSAMYKLQLVADNDLAEVIDHMILGYSSLYMDSLLRTQELIDFRLDVKVKYDLREFNFKRIHEINELSLNIVRATNPDIDLLKKLDSQRDSYTENVRKLDNKIEVLDNKILTLAKKINFENLDLLSEIKKKNMDFDLMLRKGVYGEEGLHDYMIRLDNNKNKHSGEMAKFKEKINQF